jgi:hypothetical protein
MFTVLCQQREFGHGLVHSQIDPANQHQLSSRSQKAIFRYLSDSHNRGDTSEGQRGRESRRDRSRHPVQSEPSSPPKRSAHPIMLSTYQLRLSLTTQGAHLMAKENVSRLPNSRMNSERYLHPNHQHISVPCGVIQLRPTRVSRGPHRRPSSSCSNRAVGALGLARPVQRALRISQGQTSCLRCGREG